ncbi:little elongation complex subunit 2 [Cephus cinctus]|uniref:Little elongation complex subunit 2 n=1 Tax=Cephus cinctus TaxID=211228 RepID=A0AAJ7CA53_CEPCN|nr:little elongation complex subunit 2 [Cephus cinctus]
MEEFMNIDWNPPLEDMLDNVFINEERMIAESVMYKIMRGGFTDPFAESEFEDETDTEISDDKINDVSKNIDTGTNTVSNNITLVVKKATKKRTKSKKKANDVQKRQQNAAALNEELQLKNKKRKYVPGIVRCPIKFPRPSFLTKEQQALCLRVLLRFSGSEKPEVTQTNREELETYIQLTSLIHKEQEEFLQVAKKHWDGSNLKIVCEDYINCHWHSKIENLKKLPKYYIEAGDLAFVSEKKIGIRYDRTLLEMGTIPRVILPTFITSYILNVNHKRLEQNYPVRTDKNIIEPSLSSKNPVSQDPNCQLLAEANDVDLVISSSGLNCLLINTGPNYNNTWILPVVIKQNKKGKNTIYIDKPLPPTMRTIPQKNSWVLKYILKSHLVHPNHPTSLRLSKDQEHLNNYDNHLDSLKSTELSRMEVKKNDQVNTKKRKLSESDFGKNINNATKIQKTSLDGSVRSSSNESTLENKLLNSLQTSRAGTVFGKSTTSENDLLVEDVSKLENLNNFTELVIDAEQKKIEDFAEQESDNREDHLSQELPNPKPNSNVESTTKFSKNIDIKNKEQVENVDSETQRFPDATSGRHNVSYKLFSIGTSEASESELLKNNPKDYKILYRSKIDGVEKLPDGEMQLVMLAPKLEHQVALGAEAVTLEEALKQWSSLVFRPGAVLIRARISEQSKEILQLEKRTAISINNELKRLYNVKVEDSLVLLHNVIHTLSELQPGRYLLRHTLRNGAFATIYKEIETSGKKVLDLHSLYADEVFRTIPNTPWPLLDKVVVTPMLSCFERMPAMFYPSQGRNVGKEKGSPSKNKPTQSGVRRSQRNKMK